MRQPIRALTIGCALVFVLAFGACGDKAPEGGIATTTPSPTSVLSPTQQWANTVCTSITNWQGQIARSINDITMSVSGEVKLANVPIVLKDSLSQASKATRQLVSDLTAVGTPPTQAGAQARAELTELITRTTASIGSIEQSLADVPTESLAAIATAIGDINSRLSAVVTDVAATFTRIEGLDPTGELAVAIASTPSCKSLMATGQITSSAPSPGGTDASVTPTTSPSAGTGTSATVASPAGTSR